MSTVGSRAALRIVASGPLCTIQDLGRPGWFSAGVGISGAADRRSLTLANRLVGNDENAAGIECLLGGLEVIAIIPVMLAVTGAPAPITVDLVPTGHASVIPLQPGQRMKLGMAKAGVRSYIAIRGGVAVEPVLGSRSRDTLAGLGPEVLQPGTELPVGPAPRCWPVIEVAPIPQMTTGPVTVRVVLGPRDDWFTQPRDLFCSSWLVSHKVDRVGARLTRPPGAPVLRRINDSELPTEGMPLGAIQVPPSGEPVVFLADHPITGGYPVIGTVVDDDVDLVAQARPGQQLIFRPVPR